MVCYSDLRIVMRRMYDSNELLWDSIMALDPSDCAVIDTIEGLFEIYECDAK